MEPERMESEPFKIGRIAFGVLRVTFALASTTFGLVFVGAAAYALYTWILPAWRKTLTNPSPETSIVVLAGFTLFALLFLALGVAMTVSGVRLVFSGKASRQGLERPDIERRGLGTTPLRPPGRLARWSRPRDVALVVQSRTPSGQVLLSSKRMYLIGAIVVGLFALFWNAVVFLALRDTPLRSGLFGVIWLLLGLPFVVVGVGLLAVTVYLLLGALNPIVEIELPRESIRPGETLEIRWRLRGGAGRIATLGIWLEGNEVAVHAVGTDSERESRLFHRATLVERSALGPRPDGRARLQVPAGAMHSFRSPHNEIAWTIDVHGEAPRWVDLRAVFPIRVEAEPA
jgi:hypothetical protein